MVRSLMAKARSILHKDHRHDFSRLVKTVDNIIQPVCECGMTKAEAESIPPLPDDSPLSHRERQIAKLISLGAKNTEIASALYVAKQTIKNQVHMIYMKLGIVGHKSREKLVKLIKQRPSLVVDVVQKNGRPPKRGTRGVKSDYLYGAKP